MHLGQTLKERLRYEKYGKELAIRLGPAEVWGRGVAERPHLRLPLFGRQSLHRQSVNAVAHFFAK